MSADDRTDAAASVGRVFDVIGAVAELTAASSGGVTVSDVARRLDRERSQVSRTLASLADQGMVVRDHERRYRVAWNLYATARALTDRRLRDVGLTLLDALSHETGEASFLGVLQGDATVTITESVPLSSRLIGSWVGRAYPAFCSDAGRALLWDADDSEVRAVLAATAFTSPGPNAPRDIDEVLERLDEARARGFAIVDQEAEPGLYSVSAPVRDFTGEVIAAVQIVGERDGLHARTDELGTACRTTADALSGALGAPTVS